MTRNKKVAIDLINGTITVTKLFAKNAQTMGSPEFNELRAAIKEFPDFKINRIDNPTSKRESRKGLNLKLMEETIKTYYPAQADEFDRIVTFYKGSTTNYYLKVMNWFVKAVPNYKELPLIKSKLAEIVAAEIEEREREKAAENQVQETAAAITSLKKIA